MPITEIPDTGPLPTQLYGKAAERREMLYLARQKRTVERAEKSKQRATRLEELRKQREIQKARAAAILAQQAKTREQLPLYRAVLDSYGGPGGGGRYSTRAEAAQFRKLYLKAYTAIWRWTKFREKDKRVKDKRPAFGPGIGAFYREIATAYSVVCYYCRKEIPPTLRTVDHYIPLAKGGTHTRDNLVAACWDCNIRKSDKMPERFILELNGTS